jgi:hypothetical protein
LRLEALEGRWVPTTLTPTTLADGGLGSGSLRDAVLQFNADTGTADDIIQLEAGTYSLTIQNIGSRHETAGLTGDLNLTQTSHRWIIQGAGPSTIIDASQLQDRVFQIVNPGIQVLFQDLVIQGGLAQDNGSDGALPDTTDALGGGILNNGGDVTLDNVILQNNVARGGDAGGRQAGYNAQGGGLYSTGGALTISHSTLANNQATGGRGGYFDYGGSAGGGGLYTTGGSLDISDSMVTSNRATGGRGGNGSGYMFGGNGGLATGGGLYVNGIALTISTSTITSNQGTGGIGGSYYGEDGNCLGGGLYSLATLTVSDSTLSGNSAAGSGGYGGGGAIYSSGPLTVSDSILSGNSAIGGYGSGDGGAINSSGPLTVSNSTLSSNTGVQGGGIYNYALRTLTVSNSTLSSNLAGSGGGVYNAGALMVSNSTLSGNTASGGYGGGIYNEFYGQLTVSNSTLSGNTASGGSGGGIADIGPLMVGDSTLSGNSAGAYGGGIWNYGTNPITLTNVTLTANLANTRGGSFFRGGGLDVDNLGSTVLHNTLIASNFNGATGTTRDDVYGVLDASGDYNLIGDGTGMTGLSNGINGNQVGSASFPIDPLLGPLQDNGGPTLTHALLSGSPAIDAGNNAYATDWDQRGPGYPRIVNGIIDIGAFEVQARGYPRPTPQPLPDPVPVQALAIPGGTLLGQPPDLPADSSPLPEPGNPDAQTVQPAPVPRATGQQAPATLVGTDPGTGQPVAALDSWSASDLDALALTMLGGPPHDADADHLSRWWPGQRQPAGCRAPV